MEPEVQARIDNLNHYADTDTLDRFDIVHLYPQELAYPDGFYDSRWFRLVGYNEDLEQRRDLGRHDELELRGVKVERVRIFADGPTLLSFDRPVRIGFLTQSAVVG